MELQTIDTAFSYRLEIEPGMNISPSYDLPGLIETMKQSYTWDKGELNALILLNTPVKQILLTAMHADTEIKSFQSDNSITLLILEGELRFDSKLNSIILNKGQLLTLHEKIKYKLTTFEETVFLLTISNDIPGQAEN
jgi:hypothetical protein